MFCKKCRSALEEGAVFCANCGQNQNLDVVQQPPQDYTQTNTNPQPQGYEQPQENYQPQSYQPDPYSVAGGYAPIKKKAPIVPIIAILVVAAVIGLLVFGFMQSSPEAAANNYFSAFFSKNVNGIIDNAYISPTATQSDIQKIKDDATKGLAVIDSMKIDKNSLKISTTPPSGYTGSAPETSITLDGKTYSGGDFKELYITLSAAGTTETNTIKMVKFGKNFFIFDKWVVANGM